MNEQQLKFLKEESERARKRIQERMEKHKIVAYTRVGKEEQLDRLDSLFIKGMLDDTEYKRIQARIRGARNE